MAQKRRKEQLMKRRERRLTALCIGGGILRDIMAGETPYVLKKHIYACASIAGACLYTFFLEYTRSDLAMVVSALLVIAIRMLASHYRWDLPKIKTDGE